MAAGKKSYILAPNFSYQVNGSIQIGNIIADPFRPTKPLSSLDPNTAAPEIVTTTELKPSIRHVDNNSIHGSVWAQFLNVAGGHIGASSSHDILTQYDFDSLDTTYLKHDPTEAEVEPRLRSGRVEAVMNAGLFGKQPVYMITGLKVAKGFSLKKQFVTKRDGGFGVSVPITDQVGLGGDIGRGHGTEIEETSCSANDIIFAYQLHVIKLRGRRTQTTNVDIYTPKAALLHDDIKNEDSEITAMPVNQEDITEVLQPDEMSGIAVGQALDGNEQCICISMAPC
jgi:hypothetical protein